VRKHSYTKDKGKFGHRKVKINFISTLRNSHSHRRRRIYSLKQEELKYLIPW
jgi:hypothetical protein